MKDARKKKKKKRESRVVAKVLNADRKSMKKSNIQQFCTQSPNTSPSRV